MLQGRPDESGEFGALVAQIGEQYSELWQDNVAVVEVFADMITQWNVGPGGAVGLRYEVLPVLMDLHGIASADRPAVFAGLRVMERTALEEFRRG